jgi:hypothetical protein
MTGITGEMLVRGRAVAQGAENGFQSAVGDSLDELQAAHLLLPFGAHDSVCSICRGEPPWYPAAGSEEIEQPFMVDPIAFAGDRFETVAIDERDAAVLIAD